MISLANQSVQAIKPTFHYVHFTRGLWYYSHRAQQREYGSSGNNTLVAINSGLLIVPSLLCVARIEDGSA